VRVGEARGQVTLDHTSANVHSEVSATPAAFALRGQMPYQFAQQRIDYSAFASGQVLHSLPGRTAFPVRPASEIFQRCAAILSVAGSNGAHTLYDPCCGGAQLLTTLAFLHGDHLARVIGSDIDPEAIGLAERNLALLTPTGLDARIDALASLRERYGKASHAEALAHATTLRSQLSAFTASRAIETRTFVADATSPSALSQQLGTGTIDMVIADIPHGQQTTWQLTDTTSATTTPVVALLGALRQVLASVAVVAIAAPRQERIGYPAYRRAAQWQIGKRHVVFLVPEPNA
jgi:23S rRNA (guanine2535-N1)-methyltransferase